VRGWGRLRPSTPFGYARCRGCVFCIRTTTQTTATVAGSLAFATRPENVGCARNGLLKYPNGCLSGPTPSTPSRVPNNLSPRSEIWVQKFAQVWFTLTTSNPQHGVWQSPSTSPKHSRWTMIYSTSRTPIHVRHRSPTGRWWSWDHPVDCVLPFSGCGRGTTGAVRTTPVL
jgi:hypothetical protein